MSDALDFVEQQVKLFSLEEQLHLLAYIANVLNERSSNVVHAQNNKSASVYRNAGGLTGKFWMAEDFDETPDCFKEYM